MRQSLQTVALLVLVWLAWMLRDLVMLIGFAAVLAYALDPIVTWLEHRPWGRGRRMSRRLAAGLTVVFLVVIAGGALAAAVPRLLHQLVRFGEAVPGTLARLEQGLQSFIAARGLGDMMTTGDSGSTASAILGAVRSGLTSLLGHLLGSLGGLASLILLPLFSFYLVAEAERARAGVLARVPAPQVARAVRFLDALDGALRAYVRGQALVCLAMGTVMAIVLKLLGFPVALLLGLVVGLGEIIPFLGAWIAATAIALEGYTSSPGLALAGVGAYVVVNSLMGTFVSPRLLGGQVKLHPFLINVAVIGGGILLGPAGAILALPAAAVAKAILDEFGPRPLESGR